MSYAVKVTWSDGRSEEFSGEGERAGFLQEFFGGSGAVPTDVLVEDVDEKKPKPEPRKAERSEATSGRGEVASSRAERSEATSGRGEVASSRADKDDKPSQPKEEKSKASDPPKADKR